MRRIALLIVAAILLFSTNTVSLGEDINSTNTAYPLKTLFSAFSELLSENLPTVYSSSPKLSIERLESWLDTNGIAHIIDTPYLAPALIISDENTNETLTLSCDEGYGLTMVVYVCKDYQLSTSYIANISHQYKNLQTNKLEKNLTLDQLLDKAGQTVDHNTVEDIKREVLK